MGIALAKLAEEDPTFRTYTDEETGQTIIAGMGELHLEIIVDRLLREFKVEANVGAPQVAYKETIRKTVDRGDASMPGSPAARASMVMSRSPSSRTRAARATSSSTHIVGGAIPKEYHSRRSTRASTARWRPACSPGIPVVDVKVTLYDGSYHEVDSSELAFKIAGSMAFKEACQKADPVILEPIMKVCIIVPDEYMGDVIGDVTARRGTIPGMTPRSGAQQIDCVRPAVRDVRLCDRPAFSRTQGRGQYHHGAEPLYRAAQEPDQDDRRL